MEEFTEAWTAKHPGVSVVDRQTASIPHLDDNAVTAGRTPIAQQTYKLREAFQLANELTDEVVQASHIVIATPMYNWGPPSSLKAWIDRIINTRTFYTKSDAVKDIPITFLIASGGPYSVDAGVPGNIPKDHLRPLLIECFTQIGAKLEDLTFINMDPTGPVDFGRISADDPKSGISRARELIPAAVDRIKC